MTDDTTAIAPAPTAPESKVVEKPKAKKVPAAAKPTKRKTKPARPTKAGAKRAAREAAATKVAATGRYADDGVPRTH